MRNVFRLRWGGSTDWAMLLGLLVNITEVDVVIAGPVAVAVVVVVVFLIHSRIARHFKVRAVGHHQMNELRVVLLQEP